MKFYSFFFDFLSGNCKEKSCIRETLNILTDADSITIAIKIKKNMEGSYFKFNFLIQKIKKIYIFYLSSV